MPRRANAVQMAVAFAPPVPLAPPVLVVPPVLVAPPLPVAPPVPPERGVLLHAASEATNATAVRKIARRGVGRHASENEGRDSLVIRILQTPRGTTLV